MLNYIVQKYNIKERGGETFIRRFEIAIIRLMGKWRLDWRQEVWRPLPEQS